MPSVNEHKSQRDNYIFHVAKIATEHIKCLQQLQYVVPDYINHSYIEQVSQPTVTVSYFANAWFAFFQKDPFLVDST